MREDIVSRQEKEEGSSKRGNLLEEEIIRCRT